MKMVGGSIGACVSTHTDIFLSLDLSQLVIRSWFEDNGLQNVGSVKTAILISFIMMRKMAIIFNVRSNLSFFGKS